MNLLYGKLLKLAHSVPPPLAQVLAGRKPSVLLYHGVPRKPIQTVGQYVFDGEAFERQIAYLKKYFNFIHPCDIFNNRPMNSRKAVLLTFDDGFRNNALTVAPVLRKYQVPAIFFICNRHIQGEGVLWFAYLHALRHHFRQRGFMFRGELIDMSPGVRNASVDRLTEFLLQLEPHPGAMYSVIQNEFPDIASCISKEDLADWYTGMTEEQVAELASEKLFSVEAHTVDHALLTRCSPDEAARQIGENKCFIERICNKCVTTVSYPSGDYDKKIIEACKQLGFTSGYAVAPKLRKYPTFEIPRAGIYQPFEEVAAFKAFWARRRSSRG